MFEGCTVLLGEENTSGIMIQAEVYYADNMAAGRPPRNYLLKSVIEQKPQGRT